MQSYFNPLCVASMIAILSVGFSGSLSANPSANSTFPIVKGDKAACSVIAVTGKKPEVLMTRAAMMISGPVKRWSGVDLQTVSHRDAERLPAGPAVVLTTLESLRKIAPEVETSSYEILRVASIDPQGFACVPMGDKVFVVARSVRGVFNGATWLADFCIGGPKGSLSIHLAPTVRTPQMSGRAAYTLTIWGDEAKYTVKDWETVFDRFAYDGLDRNYFWVSGHFPSKKYPQTYKCKDGNWDSTVDTKIGTVKDLRELIRYSHEMGTEIYLGSGLGGWVGTGLLTNKAPGTMKTGVGQVTMSLCPSNPQCRTSLIEYYKEMYDALPEADGMYIEMADEFGECLCPICSKPVDDLGSKQYGQSQITLIQEIAHEIWKDHPKAKFAITVGYAEHKNDPAYYDVIRQMNDPRFELMEARGSREFPSPAGKMSGPYMSKQLMLWSQHYAHPLEKMVTDANLVAKLGWYGYSVAYEPGAGTGSFYPTLGYNPNILPYAMTGFVFREVTWNPTLTVDQVKQLAQDKFFDTNAPAGLGADLWSLREIIRTTRSLDPATKAELDRIEGDMKAAMSGATPKTIEGLGLMKRAIDDTREHFK